MPRIKWSADMGPEWDVPRFRRRLRQLRRDFPAPCRVVVRFAKWGEVKSDDGSLCHALAIPKRNSWLILIVRQQNISNSIYDLWHEWAHVLEPPGAKKIHHNRFRDIHHKIIYHYVED